MANLQGYDVDIAIISESHLKKKHVSSCINITGYELFRRDRNGRKGGRIAIFSRQSPAAAGWPTPDIDPIFELMWIRIPNATVTLGNPAEFGRLPSQCGREDLKSCRVAPEDDRLLRRTYLQSQQHLGS